MYCILTEDEAALAGDSEDEQGNVDEDEDMAISLNAISRSTDYNTFRVKGHAYDKEVQILIDGGSTDCFIDEKAAFELGCKFESATPIIVSVANGYKMLSQLYCPTFTWEIQGHKFKYPIRTLTLGGCHMVLGGDWLRRYSPVEYDYVGITVTVSRKDVKVRLQALSQHSELQMVSTQSMSELLKQGAYGIVGQVHAICGEQLSFLAISSTAIDTLQSHMRIFFRNRKKDEIEKIVKELLESGVIHPSQSSFGSPVLLIKMQQEDIPKTSFVTHQGHYDKTWEEHLQQLQLMLEVLRKNQLFAKRSKCDFGKQSVEYLGHVISVNGLATDPSIVECMKFWPLPKDKDDFFWTDSATTAFEQLKAAMVSALVLALPDFAKPFVVEMDACDKGIGAVLIISHVLAARGILRKERRICVGKNNDVRQRIMRVLHDSSIGGHSGLKLTPFQALYGYVPGPLTIDPYIPTSQPEVREYLQERARMLESSVQLRRNMTLAPKYYGPFRSLAKVGQVAYRLALPPTSGIHPIFHVSLLKKKIGHKHTPTLNSPIFDQHGYYKVYPSQILARRLIARRNDLVPQVLVQCVNYSPSEATWEDYYDIVARFPDFSMDRGD
ncbi:UNVERIFIED_CONTAM: Retrovirus-related Pol polyprotein from transposon [Sesamum calycinum]|uniref:Retrovirus-related Pol polyprotein from transposon n=1 Tax=Sesamum calycinum TaxID=2727403 RepID=A0AAW2IUL2_9LAMI